MLKLKITGMIKMLQTQKILGFVVKIISDDVQY